MKFEEVDGELRIVDQGMSLAHIAAAEDEDGHAAQL
jgi:hypothetical protein